MTLPMPGPGRPYHPRQFRIPPSPKHLERYRRAEEARRKREAADRRAGKP